MGSLVVTYCVGCGAAMQSVPSSVRFYCSLKCNHRVQRLGVLAFTYEQTTCATCGLSFIPTSEYQRYCQARCRIVAERQHARARRSCDPILPRLCTGCGKEFTPRTRGEKQKYCSVDCRTIYLLARDQRRRGKAKPDPRNCLVCGKTFVPHCDSVKGVRVVACSSTCTTRVLVQLKRAKRWTDQVERIYPMIVMERDDWTCGICGDPIDPAAPFPSSRYRSIDHIVPLRNGGTHLYDNVQAAHFGCNVAKGNEIAETYMTG